MGDVAIGGASPVETFTTDDEGMGSRINHKVESHASRTDALGKEPNHATSALLSPQSVVNGDDSANEQVLRDEQEPAVVNMAEDRWESVVNDTPAIFEIADNPNAKSEELLREVDFLSEVRGREYMYHEVAIDVGVDENLLMAIAHMETTRGWYDGFTAYIAPPKSFRPMNIHYARWQPLIEELG
ncbi:MAG: hypothetical protein ACTID3_02345 [Halomonas sp.]|uniref:hypothetical protein n=1 Tax=Halomonas TaxID=2745 RepID=UPI001867E4D7|nr:hypothetical protein [Halomonas colorata]